MVGMKLLNLLQDQSILAPYVERAMLRNIWPKNLVIDNPYYHDSNWDDYFHPSTHSLYGEQAIYAKLHPDLRVLLKEDDEYKRIMTPMFGSIYHVVVQQKLILDGVLEESDVEIPLVNEEHHWKGRVDAVFERKLFDFKTMNSKAFDRIEEPYASWCHQMAPYGDELYRRDLVDNKDATILVMEMGSPFRLKEFHIPFDQNLLDKIYTKWANVRKALETDTIPDTCCEPEHARYCPVQCRGELAPTKE